MAYLYRSIDDELKKWSLSNERKPLLLRGARQVGKSSAVRNLGRDFKYFAEINFESDRGVHGFFEGNLEPFDICEKLSLYYGVPVRPNETLLFFDEIQACVPAISSLRYFYEKYPEIHLIAAGSLLEFALEELPSFAVGRVRSMFMYPFSFNEYLKALGLDNLINAKQKADYSMPLSQPIHNKLNDHLKKFLVLGGMPEVVSKYVSGSDILECMRTIDDIVISYKSDFAKYKKRVNPLRMQNVLLSAADQAGGRFVYSRAEKESSYRQIKEAIDLLIMAGLLIPVYRTSGNGIPLGAETDLSQFKIILIDTGVFQRILNLDISDLFISDNWDMINKGSIAEQYAGLELIKAAGPYLQPSLYYWTKESRNSHAELDYLVQKGQSILPVEIKSGSKGSMKSMLIYLEEKNQAFGIRSSTENFSQYQKVKVHPLYDLGRILK
ncbi:MAG: AAA family ATPase [Bacteroidales bacterium]